MGEQETAEQKIERLKKEGLGNIIIIAVGSILTGIGLILVIMGVKKLMEKAKQDKGQKEHE